MLNDDATTNTRVYRKPTHTDQYLNWDSNHHLEHKRSVVRTLLQRAENISSTEEDKQKEMKHIREALEANGYKKWIFNLPKKQQKTNDPPSRNPQRPSVTPIGLPYIKGLSENLHRLFRANNIATYHKPINTLRNLLVKPKDPTPIDQQCGLVYHIKCQDCHHNYIGETSRNMGVRFKEHTTRKGTVSAVKEHLESSHHKCKLENIKILDREEDCRKIKEAINHDTETPTDVEPRQGPRTSSSLLVAPVT